MKRLIVPALCLALLAPLGAQDKAPAPAQGQPDLSYSLGMIIGTNLKNSGMQVNLDDFMAGVKDIVGGKAPRYTDVQAQAAVQAGLAAAEAKKSADNLASGKAFLADNMKKAGVKVTASGLQYLVLSLGTGPKPVATDTVKVNYEGKLLDGSVFDSSIARNEPAVFPLDGVIPGWTEGVQLMPVGSKFRLFVPPELAYGDQGAGSAIAPNSVLVFDVELISIEPAAK